MSSCLILENKDTLIMASDSSLSSFEGDIPKRIGNNQKKIFSISNYLIFCSGNISIVEKVIKFLKSSYFTDVSDLSKYLKSMNIMKNDKIFSIEIILSTLKEEKIISYQISEYNNFDAIELERPEEESIRIYSAGIKTMECLKLAERELSESRDVISVITNVYRQLSCEEIGGYLSIWSVSKEGIEEISNNINIDVGEYHSVVGEVIVGRILAGNTLTISNSGNNFVLDQTGATLTNAKFSIQTTNSKVIIDPTSNVPFRIQKNQGGTFTDKFFVNNAGDVTFSGVLSGATGVFSGTITATTGNIGTLVIDSQGLKTSDGVNYLRGNGDLKWGGLSISGSTATFTGNIFANKLVGAVSYTQLTDIPADKITSGSMAGNRISGGTAFPSNISMPSGGQLQMGSATLYSSGSNFEIITSGTTSISSSAGGAISAGSGINLSGGTLFIYNGSIYVGGGYPGYGKTAAVWTGSRYIYFSNGILTGA